LKLNIHYIKLKIFCYVHFPGALLNHVLNSYPILYCTSLLCLTFLSGRCNFNISNDDIDDVSAFALTVGAFILLGVLSFAAFLALGSSILFAGALYILALSRTTMRRIRPTGTHFD